LRIQTKSVTFVSTLKQEEMKQLVEAVLKVMEDCKGIEKSMTVGTGNSP